MFKFNFFNKLLVSLLLSRIQQRVLAEKYECNNVSIFFNFRNFDATKLPKSADNIDISRHSILCFFLTAHFTAPAAVSINNFLPEENFLKKSSIVTERSNPDKPKMPKLPIIITDLGFQTHNSRKITSFNSTTKNSIDSSFLKEGISGKFRGNCCYTTFLKTG